ncbi:MAG: hypothetical protein MK082_01855 [Phycisphaerales bacterium]|nr:hypothetical protein [Phycisphaerales bacterium]
MIRSSLLLALVLLASCASTNRTISVSIKVEPMENHEQYLFDVMVEEDDGILANPRILVKAGETGMCQIGREGEEELILNVLAIDREQESIQ